MTKNDIKVPPFTEGQKELIKMTEKLAKNRKICDVDGVDDDMTNEEWLCEQILHFTELSTEEKAKCLAEKIEYLSENLVAVNVNKIAWLRWLKEKHYD